MKKENFKTRSEEENIQFFDDSISKLDEQRLEELKKFQDMHATKDEILMKEKKRLEAKLGSKHPRVQKIEEKLSFNKGMFAGLQKEIEKASIKQEPFSSDKWRVHGRVFGGKEKALKGLTVFLSDSAKNWIKSLGNTCTDEYGYYSITLDNKKIKEVDKHPLFLSVSEKNKKILYAATDSLTAVAGSIEFQDIYLDSEECVPPPDKR